MLPKSLRDIGVVDDRRLHASNGAVVEPMAPLPLGSVDSGQPVPVPGLDRLLTVSGSTIHEFDLDGYWSVGTTSFAGGALDATLVGDRLAIATSGGSIILVPLG